MAKQRRSETEKLQCSFLRALKVKTQFFSDELKDGSCFFSKLILCVHAHPTFQMGKITRFNFLVSVNPPPLRGDGKGDNVKFLNSLFW